MANIKEVALRAGVSTSTVSRTLSGKIYVDPETKRRVQQAVRELNYRPNALAKGLKEGRTKTLGLIIPNLHNLLFPAAIRGITAVAKKHGYTVVLCNTDEDRAAEQKDVENLRLRAVDGLIFSTATPASQHIMELKKQGYPVVLMLRRLNDELDSVIIDNYQGAYRAAQFLIERGYRRIGIINGALELDLYQQRLAGYRAALAENGVDCDERLIADDRAGWEDGYRAMHEILDRGGRPDAIFATSDPKALGVIKAIKERGLRVPEDIAVIGYDNLDMSELMDPPLTTMAQPFYEVGTKTAERLIRLINSKGKLKPVTEKLEVQLLIRGSVGYGAAFSKNDTAVGR